VEHLLGAAQLDALDLAAGGEVDLSRARRCTISARRDSRSSTCAPASAKVMPR
jgi:hypothetical protein